MRKNGFTMVELMIVIAIIAVLASIIMPKLGGARDKAAFESCKQNVKNIAAALEMYAAASNGSYGTSTSSVNSGYIFETDYLPDRQSLLCLAGLSRSRLDDPAASGLRLSGFLFQRTGSGYSP